MEITLIAYNDYRGIREKALLYAGPTADITKNGKMGDCESSLCS